jgi:hypothetical protein
LDKDDITNVYTIELMDIFLGIKMAEASPSQYDKCMIYVDNQSSIQTFNISKQ